MPDEDDLREVHDVLEGAFTDHFNSKPETFDEFLSPAPRGPRPPLGPLVARRADDATGEPVGALVATVSESTAGPDGSYVAYIGVLEAARGRGVAKGLLRTSSPTPPPAAATGSGSRWTPTRPTGADGLYRVDGLGDVVRHRVVAPGRARSRGLLATPCN